MPELPEVETIRLGLTKYLPGKIIKKIDITWAKSLLVSKKDLSLKVIGQRINSLDRRGKALMINLDNGFSLVVHLKMTGQLVFRLDNAKSRQGFGGGHPNESLVSELPDRSTRVIMSFDKGKLFFNDQRKFGWIKLVKTDNINELAFFANLGPEPLSKEFNLEIFKNNLMCKANSMIKPALLDQKVIAGVGNIYADESLFLAKIHPETRVKDISNQKLKSLYVAVKKSLETAIKYGGSTDRNYVNAEGKKGNYLNYANVFRKDNQPCPICHTMIKKIKVAGRGTHFCPKCQRIVRKKK